jgi:EmrB/QacA subfamily drug resistance transporter
VTATAPARPGAALALLCAVQFMVILDSTVTNVALDSIRVDLGTGDETLQYLISLYAVTFGGLLLLAGRTGDLVGRRKVFIAGTALFGAASLACGMAGSMPVLLGARAVQGIGAAFVSATALALLLDMFREGHARNRALGVWSALGASGAATGLILGGVLTDVAGWQLVFFVNVPPCVLAVLVAGRFLPASDGSGRSGVDVVGAGTVTLGLGALIFAVTRGQQAGFGTATALGALAAAGLLLAGFVVAEHRSASPLVPLRIFATGSVTAANVAILCLMAVLGSQGFFLTLYLQRILETSPTSTGLAIAPSAILAFVGSSLAAQMSKRLPARGVTAIGLGLVAVAQVLLSGVPVAGSYAGNLLPGLALFGLGLGTGFVGATIMATEGLPPTAQGLASGLVNTAQQVGMAIGVAALVSVAAATTAASSDPASANALVAGYGRGLLLGAFVAAVGVAAALLIRPGRKPAFKLTDEARVPNH